jgi:hypothetical protein
VDVDLLIDLVAGVAIVIAAAVAGVLGVVDYFRGMARDLRAVTGPGGTREMARLERQMALADVVALALFADGVVTDEERAALESACEEFQPDIEPKDVLERVTALAETFGTDDELRARVSLAGGQLDDEGRREAFAIVEALARGGGSRLRGTTDHRDAERTAPEALVDLFATALHIQR